MIPKNYDILQIRHNEKICNTKCCCIPCSKQMESDTFSTFILPISILSLCYQTTFSSAFGRHSPFPINSISNHVNANVNRDEEIWRFMYQWRFIWRCTYIVFFFLLLWMIFAFEYKLALVKLLTYTDFFAFIWRSPNDINFWVFLLPDKTVSTVL